MTGDTMRPFQIIVLAGLFLLAACETTTTAAQPGQCEPGVADLSRIDTALPTC